MPLNPTKIIIFKLCKTLYLEIKTINCKTDTTLDIKHDKDRYCRIVTVDSCFALVGTNQHCVAKICKAD